MFLLQGHWNPAKLSGILIEQWNENKKGKKTGDV